uniref:Putative actin cytoskeleton-regulatory complex protein pan1 n=1 Tax=Culex tarsalis TaxID=7177 RepID=A0A1Q3F0M5_CULTA
MSADEFIYSVINSDTVGQLDLNVIANTLASADALIRQIKAQQEENGALKEKITSLRSSALQIKQLYEAELGKNRGTADRERDYIRQVGELEARTRDAENARVNAELREKETVAELERKLEASQERYDGLAGDALRNAVLLAESGLLPVDQQPRLRELRSYWQTQVQNGVTLPEDIAAILAKKKLSRKKRRSDVESRDQATMTCGPTVTSTAVNTTAEPLPAPVPAKTFADKATMYSSSTVTRSTCTSAFIRRVDVGVNYPEVVPKSIDEILRECVIEMPSLLSPILDNLPPVQKQSIETQTDEPATVTVTATTSTTSVGTNTTLRNIRRRLDYVRKTENLAAGFTIKKEETISPASSIQNLPAAASAEVNPQLTQIWALLGETMFRLLGNGRLFDSQQQCYNTINERLAMVNSLIDPEARRRGPGSATQLMMSEALAAAAAQAAMLGNDARKAGSNLKRAASVPAEVPGKGGDDYEADVAEEASNEPWEDEDVPLERSPEMSPEEEEKTPEQRLEMEEDVEDVQQQQAEQVVSECAGSTVVEQEEQEEEEEEVTMPELDEEAAVESLPQENEEELETSLVQPANTSPSSDETKETETCPIQPSPSAKSTATSNSEPEKIILESASSVQPEEEPVEIRTSLPDDEATPNRPESPPQLELPSVQESVLNRSLPAEFTLADLPESRGKKHYLDVRLGDDFADSACVTDDEESAERMMIVMEGSPARTASSSYTSIGSNGTLISPIKVRETNELVKDQFKTPTSPAISKRKLRERTESGGSSTSSVGNAKKRGRMSPETESLLEDDWDRKFSTIKNYFALPSSLNPIESGAMWDDEDGDDDEEIDGEEFLIPEEPLAQAAIKEEKKVEPIAEPKPSTSTAPWDDFKVPLQIDVAPAVIVATSDSPESPPLEDSPMSPDAEAFGIEDSPMSPLPEEHDAAFGCNDSPMSPPLESRGSMYNVEPVVIPVVNPLASRLSQEYKNTPIGKTIARYNNERRGEVLRNMAPEMAPKEAAMVRRIVAMVQRHVAEEWTVGNLQRSCNEILAATNNTKLISVAIIEYGVAHQDFVLDVQCSPPAPALPKTTQQLVLLVKTMNETLYTLDKVLLHEIDRRVFTLKAGADKVMLETVTALTYLYIGISDSSRLYGCTARLFIYKCLYYFNFKGLPLIYLVLKAFPHALPKKGSVYYDNSDAMVSTIRTVLMNINFMERSSAQDAHLYKKAELMKLFKYFYGYQPGQPTYDELITNLVEKIKASKLKNVDYCLILVAKRKGYEWAKDAIVQKHLYPLLNDYLKQLDAPRHADSAALDDRICCLIFTISAILKTQPNFQDVSRFMQMFGNIVQLADGNQRVQEAAVAGLVRFTRFGFADIYEWLCRWCPSYEVSGRTKLMLATFVHRKEVRFWKQLSQREIV